MKKRYIAAGISLLFAAVLAAGLAVNLNAMLGGGVLMPLPHEWIRQLLSSRRVLLLFFLLYGLAVLGIVWCLWGRQYLNYTSAMYEVVPGFEIPVPEGQGQHGTAWWLPERQFDATFSYLNTQGFGRLPEALQEIYRKERSDIQQ